MAKVVLSLGSNIEPRLTNIQEAYLKLSRLAKTKPKSSSVYITQPHGFESENEFLNQVIFMETGLSPDDMLTNITQIENPWAESGAKKV
ncbi:MAG: 2-amino-4-hydroxy-6-hydroxymethyldihydropteridine diphosphokinase [Saprospiraceae bacterium]|nr:2-amino-4-hydroxy-6-hydroxymethyldihydropteridine diphosphokinase [Candidatus Brachybacter algidus]MBL0118211.1 2-amino-4-hydroxy-6-hydroxymethyldihydropteridine diphosphokinase [Candidatus Brachybacter algidus]